MKTIIQRLSLAVLLTTTTVTANANDLHVPADHLTIQAAVDAASNGDTIHIGPGAYYEQIRITNKNLTLEGKPGTFLRAFPWMVAAIPGDIDRGCVMYIKNGTNVILRDLTFEGDQFAESQSQPMIGVLYLDAGGTVENCSFSGFRGPEPLSGEVTNATALVVWNDLPGAPLFDFRIAGNTIVDSYHGIQLVGAPNTNEVSLNVTIENNIIRGIGPTEATTEGSPFSGLSLIRGVSGAVTGNTISDFSYSGSGAGFPFAVGLSASSSTFPNFYPVGGLQVEDNSFQDNNVHMMLLLANGSAVLSNRFEGTGPGVIPAGVYFSGEDMLVQSNKFFNMPEGIVVKGDDPIFGLIGGVATNATVVDNRFCEVTANITVQPLATATVTGTLECPFEPDLNIEQAVVLCWDEIEEGFIVESAPTSSGPWNPIEATYFLHNGKHSVAVPTDQEQQHFRLVKP